ncbi:MAG TPA: tripartite tricarboxylate transporter substrate binding protein [Ramlibacter sp.]|uniref:Bug family tripartite tricarboxylate transporter substrate binding protein n=1 Tax=Ramlibacter sp. TaxID=1917967 RepID=UPI002B972302|nr:tripartite tricarboxylate transporter substrate binding protein [Ramlibacter sp.]HVZ45744.1 tripartite tricarboxylate transporter substrate binding protein [Ramlibacter sp.]
MNTITRALAGAAIFATLWSAIAAHAQAPAPVFPTKPVHITTPFPAGAGPEVVLRAVADKLQRKWGQPVIIDNRPGGHGFIAIGAFKRGATDGHDLIQLDSLHLTAYPQLFKKLPYDPAKDFEPLSTLLRTSFFVVTSANGKYKSMDDILAAAKARPGKLNYGSWGVGSPAHLGIAVLATQTNTEMQHVVYKDANTLYADVSSGQIDFALGTLAALRAFSGRLVPLAVASPQRHAGAPRVPTVAESGGPAGFEASGWILLAAPKGVAPEVATQIRNDVEEALAHPDVQAILTTAGYDRFTLTPPALRAFIATEATRYSDLIARTRIEMD